MPRADRQSAPKREINRPSLGIEIARITENYKNPDNYYLETAFKRLDDNYPENLQTIDNSYNFYIPLFYV